MSQPKLFEVETTVIRALSWKQPYASLMLHGKIETRVWATDYRGLVLICASKTGYSNDQLKAIAGDYQYDAIIWKLTDGMKEPKSVAIAVGELIECREMTPEDEAKCFVKYKAPWKETRKSKKTGIEKTVDVRLYCHVYRNVRPIEPFLWDGKLGWSTLTEEQKLKITYLSPTNPA